MKLAYLFLAFFVVGAHCEVTESEDEFQKEFHELSDPKIKEEEAAALKEAEDEINAENEKYAKGEASFSEKLNELSDLPLKEFEKEKEGAILPASARSFVGDRFNGVFLPSEEVMNDPINRAKLDEIYADLDRQAVPDSYDSRELGLVTPAKNQKDCGSCAAFGAQGLHETCMVKAGAKREDTDLSEQHIIDCGYDGDSMNGCNGAHPHAYTEFITKAGGKSPHEAKYPYANRTPKLKCPNEVPLWKSGARITKQFYDYNCDAEKMKNLVYKYGAIMTAFYASDKGFANYAKGVFDGCTKTQINHAALIVGYGTENGKDYWVVKNSWGSKWGDGGFVKILRGVNHCGIEKICVVAECEADGIAEKPPPTPKPKPIPTSLYCDISGYYNNKGITGVYNIRNTAPDGTVLASEIKCKDSVCTPNHPGPSNACMYICGKLKCDSYP